MTDAGALATFALLSFVLIIVPGPSVLFVLGRALALGRRAALLTVMGNAVGVYAQVLLVAAGLGVVVERSVAAFTVVRLAGAVYLVWLGARAIRSARVAPTPTVDVGAMAGPAPSDRSVLREGVVVGVSNPKAIVFFAAFLPQFVAPTGAPAPVQMALLGLVFVAIALVCDSAWGLAAGTAREWLARSPVRLRRLGLVGGATMVGLGLHLAVTGRPD